MSEHDDTLKKALAANGDFNPSKANALKQASGAEFSKRMRWVERIVWIYLAVCVVIALPTLDAFFKNYDPKALITCLLVLLVVYETTVLLKLWFVIANTKLSVLKEIKQLRLEVSQLAAAAGVSQSADVLSTKYEPMRGVSRVERKAWLVALIVVGACLGSILGQSWKSVNDSELTADTRITLAEDGSATSVDEISQVHRGTSPKSGFPMHAPKSWVVRWIDRYGRELPYTITPQGTHNRYDIKLREDVMPGQRLAYTGEAEIPVAAKEENGTWTHSGDPCYGLAKNDFTVTILLPKGAELVSANPTPTLDFVRDGRPAIRLQAVRGRNEKFKYSVRYRLADQAASTTP